MARTTAFEAVDDGSSPSVPATSGNGDLRWHFICGTDDRLTQCHAEVTRVLKIIGAREDHTTVTEFSTIGDFIGPWIDRDKACSMLVHIEAMCGMGINRDTLLVEVAEGIKQR